MGGAKYGVPEGGVRVTMAGPGQRRLLVALLIGVAASGIGLPPCAGSLDASGEQGAAEAKEYPSVTIGDQVWMAENLDVTHYKDGTRIPLVADGDAWSRLGTGAYCLPAVDASAQEGAYGVLYNFHAVADPRGLCPEGWHVPTAREWRALIDYLGGPDVAGAKLKDSRPGVWKTEVPGTSNAAGFSAVPAGGRGRYGDPGEAGYYATWWSSSPHDADFAWHWGLHPDSHVIRFNPGHKASGFSVRCVRDGPAPASTVPGDASHD